MTTLEEYYGVLEESTADDLESIIQSHREARSEAYRARIERLRQSLE